jgi:putative Holliday junction resolvase
MPPIQGLYFSGMRALGLDVGSKTIGVALTDEANIAAHPLTVIARQGNTADAAAITALVTEHGVTDVVVGMPYKLSGRIGHRARRVQDFAQALRAALDPATAMHEHDERFSTAEAQRVLIEADVSRARRKEVIDQQAATIILQAWLDAHPASR